MTRNQFLFSVVALLVALPGCMLDRSGLSCPPGTMYQIGGACVPAADADMVDGGLPPSDAGDAMIMADAGLPDGDAGPVDSGPDSGPIDSGPDPIDAGTDSGPVDGGPLPDGGMRRCEDTTSGICFRFQNIAGSPEVTGWMIQFYWTVTGGAVFRLPDNRDPEGVPIFASACAALRRIDARTTECEITIPDPGMTTIGMGPFYAYPTYASGPACTSTGCPAYDAGYRMWIDGMEYSTAPAAGRMSQESRPTTAGSIVVLRITPP